MLQKRKTVDLMHISYDNSEAKEYIPNKKCSKSQNYYFARVVGHYEIVAMAV